MIADVARVAAAGGVVGPPGWRFFSFWIALAVTNLGTWAGLVALQLHVLDLTGDQAYVSAIVLAEYLPAVVLGTILGICSTACRRAAGSRSASCSRPQPGP
jgi:hypothetical protein